MALSKKARPVLVTGVAGFIGSNLAERLLAEGYPVIGIDNCSYGLKSQIPGGVVFHQLDIRSAKIVSVCKGVDTVFHLAAKNCIADCQQDPLETAAINVAGTINVLVAARENKVRKVVYAESSAVYEGSTVFPTPESEERPVSFYACSKLAAGLFARSFAALYGMRITGLRYFNVYGPRQDYRRTIPPVMPAFIISLLRGERPVIYGTGRKRRDFVYVDDVNDFHLLAMRDARTDGRVYNLGSGKNHSVNQVYEEIQRLLGVKATPRHTKDLPAEAQLTLADISRAKSLGWRPRVSLEEGLRRSIGYLKENVVNSDSI